MAITENLNIGESKMQNRINIPTATKNTGRGFNFTSFTSATFMNVMIGKHEAKTVLFFQFFLNYVILPILLF